MPYDSEECPHLSSLLSVLSRGMGTVLTLVWGWLPEVPLRGQTAVSRENCADPPTCRLVTRGQGAVT